jgi:prepilin-type processing-associated H-X9-DG protein
MVNNAAVPAPTGSGISNSMAGTLAFLLPYVEQDNVFRTFAPGTWAMPATAGWYNGSGSTARIKTFLCPSDVADSTSLTLGAFAFLVYYPGGMTGYYFPGNMTFGRTNYASCAGYLGNSPGQPYPGIYGTNTKQTTVTIADGSSNTLAFGEALGGAAPPAQRDFVFLWYSANLPTAWGLSSNPQWYQYGSRHNNSNIINFCFGDGSVRGIRNSIGSIFQFAAGTNDGANYSHDNL